MFASHITSFTSSPKQAQRAQSVKKTNSSCTSVALRRWMAIVEGESLSHMLDLYQKVYTKHSSATSNALRKQFRATTNGYERYERLTEFSGCGRVISWWYKDCLPFGGHQKCMYIYSTIYLCYMIYVGITHDRETYERASDGSDICARVHSLDCFFFTYICRFKLLLFVASLDGLDSRRKRQTSADFFVFASFCFLVLRFVRQSVISNVGGKFNIYTIIINVATLHLVVG